MDNIGGVGGSRFASLLTLTLKSNFISTYLGPSVITGRRYISRASAGREEIVQKTEMVELLERSNLKKDLLKKITIRFDICRLVHLSNKHICNIR